MHNHTETGQPSLKIALFVTAADNVVQEFLASLGYGHFQAAELTRQLKIGALLADYVVISAPYFWQSEVTYRACLNLNPLLRAGVILFSNRQPRDAETYLDLLELRKNETYDLLPWADDLVRLGYGLDKEIPGGGSLDRAMFLDGVGHRLYRGASVEELFKQGWKSSSIPLAERFAKAAGKHSRRGAVESVRGICKVIGSPFADYFSRAEFARRLQVIGNIGPSAKRMIFAGLTNAYLRANAAATDSLLLTPRGRAYPHEGELRPDRVVLRGSTELLTQVLELFGITRGVVDALDGKEILRLREDHDFQRFLHEYISLIARVTDSVEEYEGILQTVANDLHFEEEASAKQAARERIVRSCESVFYASLGAMMGLPTAAASASSVTPALLVGCSIPIVVCGGTFAMYTYIKRQIGNSRVSDAFLRFNRSELKNMYSERLKVDAARGR